MTEDELDELLASIDAPAESDADAEERVWQNLRAELFAESSVPPLVETSDSHDVGVVTDVDVDIEVGRAPPKVEESARTADRSWAPLLLAAAAAALVLAGVAAIFIASGTDEVRMTDEPTPSLPAPADRPEACLRFRLDHASLGELEESITADDGFAPELIDETRQGLTELRDNLEAVDSISLLTSTQTFPSLDGALNQARLFLLAGDIDAARQALDFAQDTYEESELATDRCLG